MAIILLRNILLCLLLPATISNLHKGKKCSTLQQTVTGIYKGAFNYPLYSDSFKLFVTGRAFIYIYSIFLSI
jgi:hypothetical protein